jgi:hypothetical protein
MASRQAGNARRDTLQGQTAMQNIPIPDFADSKALAL